MQQTRLSTAIWMLMKLGFLLVGIGFCSPILALDPTQAITQYNHAIWRKDQGLPSNGILALTQTKDGYLWLGTFNGLVRFDGLQFKIFNKGNTKELKSNITWKILEDNEGSLWIGTNGGGLMRMKQGTWKTFTVQDGLTSNIITALYQDSKGLLWIGTRTGLNCFQPNHPTADFQVIKLEDNSPVDNVRVIGTDPQGTVLVGSHNTLYRIAENKSVPYATRQFEFDAPVWSIYTDRSAHLWVGTRGKGLYKWQGDTLKTYTTEQGLSSNIVSIFHEDKDGNLWIGTDGGGLNRFWNETFSVFSKANGLSGDDATSIFEDREGSLWIGTYRDGLNQLQNSKFLTYTTQEGLSNDTIWQIYTDTDQSVWICTNDGLSHLNNGKITNYKLGVLDNAITAIIRDRSGNLWIGSRSSGLNLFQPDAKGERFTSYTIKDGLPSNLIRCLCEDRDGNLWMGTSQGLCCKRGNRFTTYTTHDGLSVNTILGMNFGSDGSLWIGTDGGGLNRFKDGHFTSFTTQDGLASEVVFSIYEDSQQVLWITTNNGLSRFRNGVFTTLSAPNGLCNETVYQVLEDTSGNFWVSSNSGIFQVSKQELNDAADQKIQRVACTMYGKSDGMKTDECNTPAMAAKTQNGNLWFPTLQGVVVIDPQQIPINPLPPPVVIEEISANRQVITSLYDGVTLLPNQEDFIIRFTALTFCVPGKVKLKYRLRGVQDQWVEVGTQRLAHYSQVPPGEYVFEVIACNNDAVWNATGASLRFRLQPAWWQTWWAWIFYSVVVIGIIYGSVRLRTRFLEVRNQRLRLRIGEQTRELAERNFHLARQKQELSLQTEELQNANLKLQELDRIKASFTATLVHDLKSPLTVVKTTLEVFKTDENILASPLSPLIEASERSVDKILTLVNEVLEMFRSEAQDIKLERIQLDPGPLLQQCGEEARVGAMARQITVEIWIEPHLPLILADPGKLERVLSNLLSNAIKFTPPGGKITLEACTIKGTGVEAGLTYLHLSITDTGEGIPAEDIPYLFDPYHQAKSSKKQLGVGLGLSIVKRIVAAHGGNLSVRSQMGVGSSFTIDLPTLLESDSSKVQAEKNSLSQNPEQRQTTALDQPKLEQTDPSANSRSILIVEDNLVNQKILIIQLKKMGFEVDVASNGLEALEAVSRAFYKLILMDCYMPHMDGFETTQEIRHREGTNHHTPIIALTGETNQETVEKCLESGMDDFLGKPYQFAELKTILERWTQVRNNS